MKIWSLQVRILLNLLMSVPFISVPCTKANSVLLMLNTELRLEHKISVSPDWFQVHLALMSLPGSLIDLENPVHNKVKCCKYVKSIYELRDDLKKERN